MKGAIKKIYIDTNVIINYCTGVENDVKALNYIFSKCRREMLFTSSLSVVQTISNLQTKKKTRAAFDRLETIAKMETVLKKLTQLDLTSQDIEAAFALINNDIEDNVHYILSQKRKCEAIITNNIKDFSVFNIKLINPKNRMLKSYVN